MGGTPMRHPMFTPVEYVISLLIVGAACFLIGRL